MAGKVDMSEVMGEMKIWERKIVTSVASGCGIVTIRRGRSVIRSADCRYHAKY